MNVLQYVTGGEVQFNHQQVTSSHLELQELRGDSVSGPLSVNFPPAGQAETPGRSPDIENRH